jgi:hypothetical protein
LDAALARIPLLEMERRGNPTIATFRQLGGPGLLVPTQLGKGQEAVDRTASLAVELLGAGAFIQPPEVAYLLAATRVLSLPPPARRTAGERLDAYLTGSPAVMD